MQVKPMQAWAACLFFGLVASQQLHAGENTEVAELRSLQEEVMNVVKKGMECTVCVRSAKGGGSGSGVIINEDGLILTAAHVTQSAGKELVVIFHDGRKVKAKPLGANRNRDAGLVQITEEGKYPFMEMGRSVSLKPNQWCVSMGHPGGFDPRRTPPVRLGRVLRNGPYITTDCTLIGGDSGGPLFDLEGNVIGIHSNIGQSLSQNNHVPIDVYHDYWDRMKDSETWGRLGQLGGDPNRAALGCQLSSDEDGRGVAVTVVLPGSPADKAGIKVGDFIQVVGEQKVESAQEVIKILQKMKPGQSIKLKLMRGDATKDVTAKLIQARKLPRPKRPQKSSKDQQKDEKKEDETDEKKTDKADGLDLEALLQRAKENGGRLSISPAELKKLQQQVQKRMGRRTATTPANDEWFKNILTKYEPVVDGVVNGVLPVFVNDRQVALATAVHENGMLLTKASEIEKKEFAIGVGKEEKKPGKVVKIFKPFDLALVQIEGQQLNAVPWESDAPKLGMFIAAAGTTLAPEAIGVVSVLKRSMDGSEQGFLGVQMELVKEGIKLMRVMPRSPAAKAGLKPKDVIAEMNGQKYKTIAEFAKVVSAKKPGDKIVVKVLRDGSEFSTQIKLVDRDSVAQMPGRQQMMNTMGGRLSKKRTGFRTVLQHDGALDPQDCGGPLVNLDGEVIGINIARAGRVKSYAIPTSVIRTLLEKELPGKNN